MPATVSTLEAQIEAAYHYRGNVTLTLRDGVRIDGFIFNREFHNPKLSEDQFVEVFLAGSGARQKVPIAAIQSVTLTGEDHAAGKSYHEWLAKQHVKQQT